MPEPLSANSVQQIPLEINRASFPLLGISSCLLGHKVRYDGDHQYQPLVFQYLAEQFQLVHFCPEVAIGLGVPRPKIQLVERAGEIRCLDQASESIDYTQPLARCCDSENAWLTKIAGYVLKTKSPSCGVSKVKTRYQHGLVPDGQGIFARELQRRFPRMPLIEEDQLSNALNRNRFIEQALNYYHSLTR